MRNLFAVVLLLLVSVACPAFSFPDVEHTKKWQAAASDTVTEFELFLSPIMPGSKWGIGLNFSNIKKMVQGKLEATWTECKITVSEALIKRYCLEILVPTDPEIQAFQNDPRPMRGFKEVLEHMKCMAFHRYKRELQIRYGIIPQNPLADDIDHADEIPSPR